LGCSQGDERMAPLYDISSMVLSRPDILQVIFIEIQI
jgi:hypothetical protein